jgi:hypothetical protein
LAQVRAWNTQHLTEAATRLSNSAVVCEDAFRQLAAQMSYPGGSPWEGVAAEAAQERALVDHLTVTRLADKFHDASAVARDGKRDIDAARQGVLLAVKAADDAGFIVTEDFSVTSRGPVSANAAAAWQIQANSLAAELRIRLTELIATDQQVAAKITGIASDIDAVRLEGTGDNRPAIRLVEHQVFREGPPLPEPPSPSPGPMPPVDDAQDVKRVLDPLQNGGKRGPNGVGTNPDVTEVWDTGAIQRLWDYLTRNAEDGDGRPDIADPCASFLTAHRSVFVRAVRAGTTPSTSGTQTARIGRSTSRTRRTFLRLLRLRTCRRSVIRRLSE